jgi:hypothetical protein
LALANPFGAPWAELLSILPDHDDQELSAFLREYSRPVQISDPQFGLLDFDKRVNWFAGKAEWCGTPVRLTVSLDDENKPDPALQTARELLEGHGGVEAKGRCVCDFKIARSEK